MHAKPTKTLPAEAPSVLADVALLDARACAAGAACSISHWYAEVAAGRAPQPVIRQSRFTRWKAVSVREYLARLAEQGIESERSMEVVAQAKRASAEALRTREKEVQRTKGRRKRRSTRAASMAVPRKRRSPSVRG